MSPESSNAPSGAHGSAVDGLAVDDGQDALDAGIAQFVTITRSGS